MLRSWWLPWSIILMLLLGIGGLEADLRLSRRGPISIHRFQPFETPVAVVAADMRLYAYRWAPGDPLTILVMRADGTGIETCAAGEGFARWFELLTDVRNGGQLEPESVDLESAEWASVTVGEEWENGGGGGTRFAALIPREGEGPVIVESFGTYYVVKNADPTVWGLIWSGCAGLGARPS